MKRILAFLLAAALIGYLAMPVAAETTYQSGETVKLGGMKFKVPDGLTAEESADGSIGIALGKDSFIVVRSTDISEYKSEFMRQYMLATGEPESWKKLMTLDSKDLFSIEYQIQKDPVEFVVKSFGNNSMLVVFGTFIHGDYIYSIIFETMDFTTDFNYGSIIGQSAIFETTDLSTTVGRTAKASFDDDEMVLFESFLKSIKF